MDDTEELHLRMQVTNLEARLEMCEIERADLRRILKTPLSSSARISEGLKRSRTLEEQARTLSQQLEKLRSTHPHLKR
jgi:hypothetical protein